MTSRILQVVLTFSFFSFFYSDSSAQATIEFRISSLYSNVDDMDGWLNDSDPAFCYEILDNTYGRFDEGNVEYGGNNCLGTRSPNDVFFSEVYNCGTPASYRFRWRARENDDAVTGDVSWTGGNAVTSLQTINIPGTSINLPQGAWTTLGTYTATAGGDACGGGGTVTWRVTLQYRTVFTSFPDNGNDLICNAVNLGTLTSGGSLGNANLSNYNNYCGSDTGDPEPWLSGNEQGVWFQFTTGNAPSATMNFDLNNDPQSVGDAIDLQVALYESSNGTCTGALTMIQEDYDGLGVDYDEEMDVNCLNPNSTYFLLVDGNEQLLPFGGGEGYFGLQINDLGIQQAGDLICDGENLGLVPDGGSVGTTLLSQTNICASNTNDPTPAAWSADKTVWYMFQAPASGNVVIDVNSDLPFPIGTDAVDIQLAVYETSNGTCTGTLNHFESNYTPGTFDEELNVKCLTPGQNYWVLIDGSAIDTDGIFDITITDGGIYPATNDLICNAIALGEPAPGGTVGLTNQYNFCASNLFEPIPINWGNDQGVWYTFIAPPSGKVEIRLDVNGGISGPDPIDLQVAVYDLTGAVCTGNPTELVSEHDGIGIIYDEEVEVDCLIAGREYWIMVDGEGSLIDPGLQEGIFDIEVYADPQDAPGTNNEPCSAIPLGDPSASSVGTTTGLLHGSQNNFCADATGEPQPSQFTADQTVWYTFVAPSTGSVNIQVISDLIIGGVDPINIEIAVYKSASCTGPWEEQISGTDVSYNIDFDVWCLETGEIYYLQIDGAPPELLEGHEGYFDITITEIAPIPVSPNNDICFAKALGDPWTSGAINISDEYNLCADDIGDPVPSAFSTNQTVWYTISTPATGGPFAIDVQATSDLPWPFGVDAVDLQLALFESSDNTCTGTLSEMNSGYSLIDLNNEFLNVQCLEEGMTYFLMVDGSNSDVQGYFDLDISAATPVPIPTNDDLCNSINLGTVPIGGTINNGVDYSNFCSDTEPGESNVYLDGIQQTVWFSFVAPNHAGVNATSNVTVNITSDPNGIGDQVDLQLAVYSSSDGTCNGSMTLTNNGSNDPALSYDASVSATCLSPGQTYFVQVDGSILNLEGYFTIDITDDGVGISQPYNTVCFAEQLGTVPDGGNINNGINYTNLCMDTELGEPDPSEFAVSSTAWFTFLAPTSGNVTINALNDPNLIGDEVDLQLALWYSDDNTCNGNFLEVDSEYDALNKDELLTVDCLDAGRVYFLQVDGSEGILGDEDGWFTLEITDDGGTSNAPYNNNICDAYDFGTPGVIQTLTAESNMCANIEVDEPGLGTYATHSVWYQFIAPPSGQVEVNVVSTDLLFGIDPEVYIHSSSNNTCSGALTEVESSMWPIALIAESIQANCFVPGDTYFIQVDGSGLTLEGTFNISIEDLLPNYGTGLAGDVEPTNNDCSNAVSLTVQAESCFSGAGIFDQLNYGIPTPSVTPPALCGSNCGDTWYSFTMPTSGSVLIEGNDDAIGGALGDYSTLGIVAYTGTCASLNAIDCGIGGLTDDVSLSMGATPGATVYLQIFNDGGQDNKEDFELCISEGCGFDDCLDAAVNPVINGLTYCFNTSSATGEDIASGDPGYFDCSEADNPQHSVYFSFYTDAIGTDVTIYINALINGTCNLGVIPTDGFNLSIFQDNTPCDNNETSLLDCQQFTSCDAQPINWSDTYTGLSPNTAYIIQIDGGFGAIGGNISGSLMVYGNVVPLGAQLINFSGENQGRSNLLSWTTIQEENNDYFKLFSSKDGVSFELLEEINGHGNSFEEIDYTAIDSNPNNDITYYKLVQVDFDGLETEKGIISVNSERTSHDLLVVPNPVNDISKVIFTSDVKQYSSLKIMTGSGKIVSSKEIDIQDGLNSIFFSTNELSIGFYYLIITIDDVEYKAKFIKS